MARGDGAGKALRAVSGTNLDAQGAANAWAGTTGLSILAALNVKAGTTGKGWAATAQALNTTFGINLPLERPRV